MPEIVPFRLTNRKKNSVNVGWVVAENGCHLWQGARNHKGYGQVHLDGRTQHVHRVRYERENGPVPEGMYLDHFACDNGPRGCCNPAHLRPVSPRENMLRSDSISSLNLAKTHCPQGHPYTPENLSPAEQRQGHRKCRICVSERQKVYGAKHKHRISATKRAAYLKVRDKVIARSNAYYWAHREDILAKQREKRIREKGGQ